MLPNTLINVARFLQCDEVIIRFNFIICIDMFIDNTRGILVLVESIKCQLENIEIRTFVCLVFNSRGE